MTLTYSIVAVSEATRMLIEARNLDDVRHVHDLADAARLYARKAHLGLAAQNNAAAISIEAQARADEIIRAARKAGELAKRGERNDLIDQPDKVPTLADIEVSLDEAAAWAKLAKVPEAKRAEYVAVASEANEEVSRAGLLRYVADQRRGEPPGPARAILPDGVYDTIYADPPWQYDFTETPSRAIENQYPTLPVEAICDYHDDAGRSISEVIAEDAILFLWATNPLLREALQVVGAWGFEYVTNAVWVKDRIGMGYWVRQQHELLLICRRGNVAPPEQAVRRSSVIEAPRRGHSVKPDEVYDLIESMLPNGKWLECFARRGRSGWTAFGNAPTP